MIKTKDKVTKDKTQNNQKINLNKRKKITKEKVFSVQKKIYKRFQTYKSS